MNAGTESGCAPDRSKFFGGSSHMKNCCLSCSPNDRVVLARSQFGQFFDGLRAFNSVKMCPQPCCPIEILRTLHLNHRFVTSTVLRS